MAALRQSYLLPVTIILSIFWLGCGGAAPTTAECPPPAGATLYAANGNEGTINGQISFTGNYQPAPLDMAADAACAKKSAPLVSEEIVTREGKLQNVFLFIKEGQTADGKQINDLAWPVPSAEVRVDQNGCVYAPHVVGVQAGQKVAFTNSDATVHNVNAQPNTNPKFNQTQAAGQAPIVKSFCQPEQAIRVKCNQHGWMTGWVNVVRHPFFAVSDAAGAFTIKGLPPGQYTLVAWHEKLGEKTLAVTVPPKGTTTADFTFAAQQIASQSGRNSLTLGLLELSAPHAH